MCFGQRAQLYLQRLDLFLQPFEVGGAFAVLGGKRTVDLALQPLLEIADLCVERGGVGHRAAFLGRLGQGIHRPLEARHARGQIGEVGRRLDLTVFKSLDAGIERAKRRSVAFRRTCGFELGQAALDRREVRRRRVPRRKLVPEKRHGDDTDQATEKPGSEVREEPLELSRARPWRRLLGTMLRLRSSGIGCLGLYSRVGRTGLARRRIDGHLGRSALDGWRRPLAGTRVELIAKRLSHYAYRRCSNRGTRSFTRMPPLSRGAQGYHPRTAAPPQLPWPSAAPRPVLPPPKGNSNKVAKLALARHAAAPKPLKWRLSVATSG